MNAIATTANDGIAGIAAHVERIRALMGSITESVAEIARHFGSVADSCGGVDVAIDRLHNEMPGIALSFWRSIAKVHERRLHPLALSSGCSCLAALERMPIREQERALTVGVPVATGGGDHRLVPAHLLRAHELRIATTDDGRIRSISEQESYVAHLKGIEEEARAKHIASLRETPAECPDDQSDMVRWRIVNGRCVIIQTPLYTTEAELLRMVKEIRRDRK